MNRAKKKRLGVLRSCQLLLSLCNLGPETETLEKAYKTCSWLVKIEFKYHHK
jgi:hypothetical protein